MFINRLHSRMQSFAHLRDPIILIMLIICISKIFSDIYTVNIIKLIVPNYFPIKLFTN